MLHLSTIRQHFDSGFRSVLSLIEDLEQQIESLTLANQSPLHISQLQKTVIAQRNEIIRLSRIIEDKSELLFKSRQGNYQVQNKLKLQLAKAEKLHRRLESKYQLHLSNSKQLNSKLQAKIRELENCLESDAAPPAKLDSHNSSLPPSLDPPWSKPKKTGSLRRRSGKQVGGVSGHRGFTLRQVSDPDHQWLFSISGRRAAVFCRVRSYLSSARKQGRSLLAALEQSLKGKPIALTG